MRSKWITFSVFIIISYLCLFEVKDFSSWNSQSNSISEIVTEMDEETVRIDYVDNEGRLIMPLDKGYSTRIRKIGSDGRIIKEMYYDTNNSPIEIDTGYYAVGFVYDLDGYITDIMYLNQNGSSCMTNEGYSSIKRIYDIRGRVKKEIYFDNSNNPVARNNGCYGIEYEYNQDDKVERITFIGLDGSPVLISSGYSMLQISYNRSGVIVEERYLDEEGNPISLSEGQYGVIYSGKHTFFTGEDGNFVFDLNNILDNYPFVILLVSAILTFCVDKCKGHRKFLLMLAFFIIIYGTIISRRNIGKQCELVPFWSYKQFFTNPDLRFEILRNIWMFVPFGAALESVLSNKKTFIIIVVISLMIEVIQWCLGIGLAEIDDIISNSIGGFVGAYWIYKYEINQKGV